MADIKNVIVVGDGPVKDAAALHGADIGYIWASGNVALSVDYQRLEDGWVPITNPNPWPGKYNPQNKQGWVKWARLAVDDPTILQLLISYYPDGRAPTVKVVK
jgi:hypothetical protein